MLTWPLLHYCSYYCQIKQTTSTDELQQLLDSEEYDFKYDLGIITSPQDVDRDHLVSMIALHYGILAVKGEIDQIISGLSSTLDALHFIRSNAGITRSLFVFKPRPALTVSSLFDMLPAKLSELGSTSRIKQEATIMLWSDFLEMTEGMWEYI